ncbi:polysaccharide deacetylase family protein [Amylibacter sp. IMCC11727]|uniref:polysaccharide deacetylase family protein n=1 Tax=Amylibacter sp. IMCC11727 TaxID=3039851 RepID=UPI00244E571E|nr:polysaccharide deacetylase family protein [Amylibacter sp. IMCC11727]WGI22246.1 polysaccharide deacetylase family protein [Amylibacter sp. IMCC11727]
MNWQALEAEFDAWRAADLILPFWWRDDDAVTVTPALHDLLSLSQRVEIPVHLAVIPNDLQPDLASFVTKSTLIPIAHGFAHKNHADAPAKKCEYPENRSFVAVQTELVAGHKTLRDAFGDDLAPMFVPPWNRFAHDFLSILQDIGYTGFSTFTPRRQKNAADGLEQVNTHVDPIDWRGARSVVALEPILDHTVRSLQDRRLGRADNSEPFGFLTHHLVHDPAIWAFCEQFLTAFAKGPTRIWTAQELMKG